MAKANKIIPVILCGGSGTRLWPISRENMPKQFLSLTGKESLLQMTALRATDIAEAQPEDLVIVTLGAMKKEVLRQLDELDPSYTRHVLAEPVARDTAGAVAFAALYVLEKFGPDTTMWILPADHHIGDEHALANSVRESLPAVNDGYLVTFGIQPTRADTGYGYIRTGGALNEEGTVLKAAQFVEKPDLETAKLYLDSGNFMWNSGMFLFRTDIIAMNFRSLATEVYDIVAKSMQTKNPTAPLGEVYATLPKQPFDKAIMEKADKVAVTPCNPEWSDIGGWESLWEVSPKDKNGNVVDGKAALHDSKDCIVYAQGDRLVACAGLENIVVAETNDAILVADKRNGDSMKFLVNAMKASGQKEVIEHAFDKRPWGMFKVLSETKGYKIKEIVVNPGGILSLQSHQHRSEFWVVVEGEAQVTIGKEQKILKEQETAFIPAKETHRLANMGKRPLKLVEVQCGDYLGEDDIVRYDDVYGRAVA